MSYRSYLKTWALALALLLAVVAAINVAVDPFDVFGAPRIRGFNATKPAATDHTYLVKTHQLARQRPATVILGTSRADIGIDPDAPEWPAACRPVYNFGIPGSEIFSIARNLEQAASRGSVKTALFLVEVETFMGANLSTRDWSPPSWRDVASDKLRSAFTMTAFLASMSTVATQRRGGNPDIGELGGTTESAFRRDTEIFGYGELFAEKNDFYVERARYFADHYAGHSAVESFGPDSAVMRRVRGIIEFCRRRGIRPIFVLSPSHADLLETFSRFGLWPAIEEIKRSMAGLGRDVEVWDFMGYDEETTDLVPARNDQKSKVRWFWDGAHFKRTLGQIIVRRVFGAPGTFGARITPETIDDRLAEVRARQVRYRATAPARSGVAVDVALAPEAAPCSGCGQRPLPGR